MNRRAFIELLGGTVAPVADKLLALAHEVIE
jgi:hypothetical protein